MKTNDDIARMHEHLDRKIEEEENHSDLKAEIEECIQVEVEDLKKEIKKLNEKVDFLYTALNMS